MAIAPKVTYPHIVKEPGYCGGKAAIDRTRIRVNNVVFLHKQGRVPEEIREAYPDLTPAQIHAALAYYYDNRAEIEAELEEETRFVEKTEQQWEELTARHGGHPPENPAADEKAIPRTFRWPPKA